MATSVRLKKTLTEIFWNVHKKYQNIILKKGSGVLVSCRNQIPDTEPFGPATEPFGRNRTFGRSLLCVHSQRMAEPTSSWRSKMSNKESSWHLPDVEALLTWHWWLMNEWMNEWRIENQRRVNAKLHWMPMVDHLLVRQGGRAGDCDGHLGWWWRGGGW